MDFHFECPKVSVAQSTTESVPSRRLRIDAWRNLSERVSHSDDALARIETE
jgi:hypothetical protein